MARRRRMTAEERERAQHDKVIKNLNAAVSTFVQAVKALVSLGYERQIENLSARYDILQTRMDAIAQISEKGIGIVTQTYVSAIKSSMASITDGVNEGAYAAANALVDSAAAYQKFGLDKSLIEMKEKFDVAARAVENENRLQENAAEMAEAGVIATTEFAKEIADMSRDVEVSALGFGFSTGDAIAEVVDLGAQVLQATAGVATAMIKGENEVYLTRLKGEQDLKLKQTEILTSAKEAWIDAGAEVQKAWLAFAQKIENKFLVSEAAANTIGVDLGFSGVQLQAFKREMLGVQTQIAYTWGKTLEDMKKLQDSYIQNTGRNIVWNQSDFDTTFANEKLFGEGVPTQITSGMEIFNKSVTHGNKMMFEMYGNLTKMGLSAKKFGQDLVQNLRLANKYNFNGGVQGLMNMSMWAQQTRFNMNNLDSMVGNIQTGGLENVITKGAQMQVLGGQFALGANPLAMAWETFMDPEAFAKRQQKQISGLGRLNRRTGEVDLSIMERQQLNAFAQASGQSVEDLMNQIRQRVKGDEVVKNLNPAQSFNKIDQSLITNRAFIENGEWVVTMNNGENKAVSQLTADDMLNIMPQTQKEELVQHVKSIRDMMTRLTGIQEGNQAKLQAAGYTDIVSNMNQRMMNVYTDFNNNFYKYLGEMKIAMGLATEAQKTFQAQMAAGNKDVDEAKDGILGQSKNIESALGDINRVLKEKFDVLNGIQVNPNMMRKSEEYAKKAVGELSEGEVDKINKMLALGQNGQDISSSDLMLQRAKAKNRNILAQGRDWLRGLFMSDGEAILRMQDAIKDGYANGTSKSMIVAASSVTPINDGVIAQSDPQDHAIFAKVGGPFDNLFKGILPKVEHTDSVVNSIVRSVEESTIYNNDLSEPPVIAFDTTAAPSPTTYNVTNNNDSVSNNNTQKATVPYHEIAVDGGNVSNNSVANAVNEIVNSTTSSITNNQGSNGGDTITTVMPHYESNSSNVFGGGITRNEDGRSYVQTAITKVGGNVTNSVDNGLVEALPMPYQQLKVSRGTEVPSDGSTHTIMERYESNSSNVFGGGKIAMEDININFNGSIMLQGTGGQNVDVMDYIKNDPNFMRTFTQMIVQEVEKKVNGGKVSNPLHSKGW